MKEMSQLRRVARSLCVAASIACIAIATNACGEEKAAPEVTGPAVTLRVTRDFGRETLAQERLPIEGHRTALRMLEENHDVEQENQAVVSIDGIEQVSNPAPGEQETSWAVFVNGVETDVASAYFPVDPGDVVQFDLRDYYVTLDVRATIGAFPQPFTGGMLGVRFPVTVKCSIGYHIPCRQVRRALRRAGVDPYGGHPRQPRLSKLQRIALQTEATIDRATILVGPWYAWRTQEWARWIDRGPRFSGVFARFGADARSLDVLDWDTHGVKRFLAGTGLVAAIRPTEADLRWYVTGVDLAGVEHAADALTSGRAADAYAVVAGETGVENLPVPSDP